MVSNVMFLRMSGGRGLSRGKEKKKIELKLEDGQVHLEGTLSEWEFPPPQKRGLLHSTIYCSFIVNQLI